ncbi:hypothetical protein HD554DRAFT_2025818, partial [Boletus coccyginus]
LLPAGATAALVILASNKTQLSYFKDDKNAWPMYLSIGNISTQPSCHTSILLGYIPASKLKVCDDSSVVGQQLFHYCMKKMLELLVATGENGVDMVCGDG